MWVPGRFKPVRCLLVPTWPSQRSSRLLRAAVLRTLATITPRGRLTSLLTLRRPTARLTTRLPRSITTLLIEPAAAPGLILALSLALRTLAARRSPLLVALLRCGVALSRRLPPALLLLLLLSTALPMRLGGRVAASSTLT